MKIAMMSGAYVNSGDFLIEQRSKALLEAILNADVDILKRDLLYDSQIEDLNRYDEIVFAGGPIYQPNIYPERIPFVEDLSRIEAPIRILGGGWKGHNDSIREVYKRYTYGKKMLSFLQKVSNQYSLGCRDWQTVRNLQHNGIKNVVMTGCPAWYDVNKVNTLVLKDKYNELSINDPITIGVSDPALACNKLYFYELIHILQRNFKNVKIKIFYHRGISSEDLRIAKELCSVNAVISYIDMSGSNEGFEEYNQCFMHIGFRVHAHIYNLSQGNVSILINEDARGIGVNHALGLENINCLLDNARILKRKLHKQEFEMIIMDYLKYIEQSKYAQYNRALISIKATFNVMESFIYKMR